MPYKKYARRRRMSRRTGSYRRSTYNNKHAWYNSNNAVPLAEKALQTAQWVASLVNAEYKYDETSIVGGVADDSAGNIQLICNPSQGLGATNRTGDSIKAKSLILRGSFDQSLAMNPNSICRLIVLLDKENQITTLAQLLQITGGANTPFSPKNEDNKYDSKILYDKTFTTSTAYPIKRFVANIKLGFHVHFDAGTTTISNNALKVFAMSGIGVVTAPLVSYIARVSYLDN